MAHTFRILSALLSYPVSDLLDALDSLPPVLDAERLLPDVERRALGGFITRLGRTSLLDAQEAYVGLFDRNRSLSLHLFEHVHGESRERGQAMVRLAALYRLHGLEIAAHELPDYLPLYLEFLSLLPAQAARSLLAEAAPVIAALADKLESRGSDYAAPLHAAVALAARPADAEAVSALRDRLQTEADSLAALDAAWEEEAVRFVASTSPEARGSSAP
jgi:nitrate reductase molybdenum cofactor assembly chaperone NarJ/NarW